MKLFGPIGIVAALHLIVTYLPAQWESPTSGIYPHHRPGFLKLPSETLRGNKPDAYTDIAKPFFPIREDTILRYSGNPNTSELNRGLQTRSPFDLPGKSVKGVSRNHAPLDTVHEVWMRHYSNARYDTSYSSISPSALIVDDSGNVYVTGSGGTKKYGVSGNEIWANGFQGICMMFDGQGNLLLTNVSGTAKFNHGGEQIWSSLVGGTDLAIDYGGNTYVGIAAITSACDNDIEPNCRATYFYETTRLDSLGAVDWTSKLVFWTWGPLWSPYNQLKPCALAYDDESGHVYVTGDTVTIKYSGGGAKVWMKQITGVENAVDQEGHLYLLKPGSIVKYDSGGTALWSDDTTGGNMILRDDSGYVYTADGSFTRKYTQAGLQLWVASYGGQGFVLDDSGNVYLIGTTLDSVTNTDFRTVKLNRDGEMMWENFYNGPAKSPDLGVAVDCDGAGNVYVTGSSQEANGSTAYATVRYDDDGQLAWVSREAAEPLIRSYDENRLIGIGGDQDGNVYVSGRSQGWVTGWDYATVKYSPTGEEVWVQRYTPGSVFQIDMIVDSADNIYITGDTTLKYDADGVLLWESDSTGVSIAVDDSSNVILMRNKRTTKLDVGGNLLWSQENTQLNSELGWASNNLAVDNLHNSIVCVVDLDIGDDFLMKTIKYSPDGSVEWSVSDTGAPRSVCVDVDNNVYVIASRVISGSVFGSGWYLMKYTPQGQLSWSERLFSGIGSVNAIAIDTALNLFIPVSSIGISALIQLDPSGTLVWYNIDTVNTVSLKDIELDQFGNIYLGGTIYNYTSERWDFLAMKFNSNGDLQWRAISEGAGDGIIPYQIGLEVDDWCNVFLAGTSYTGDYYSNPTTSMFTVVKYEQIPTGVSDPTDPPASYLLHQNYPNPFNPSTIIRYQLPVSGWVALKVFNMLGQEVATLVNERKDPGNYEVEFDGSALPSGVYLCRMTTTSTPLVTKMLLVR